MAALFSLTSASARARRCAGRARALVALFAAIGANQALIAWRAWLQPGARSWSPVAPIAEVAIVVIVVAIGIVVAAAAAAIGVLALAWCCRDWRSLTFALIALVVVRNL